MTDAPAPPPALLVVDDDPFIRGVMDTFLTGCGFKVLMAGSGAEAIQLSRAHSGPIPLLITDLYMPGMDGRELVERLLPERPDMRVIYMSGDPDRGRQPDRVLCAYIAKPFTMSTLNDTVQALLA